ncbi:hypothetical protein HBE96_09100 [Clostridium sp. P21]|uniref:Uncharacterized protein n=1 Tax=Clostridium muellerianum TaxID=2716538 RepID=A0A7Y0EG43_9CLOT|nr:hypothetical protein [Clostridium muellerianum]NMM62854.1 hypothetical protein [Clostridium muellerianum]
MQIKGGKLFFGDIKQWSFGFKELKFFLFKKKIYKICGRKQIDSETKKEWCKNYSFIYNVIFKYETSLTNRKFL